MGFWDSQKPGAFRLINQHLIGYSAALRIEFVAALESAMAHLHALALAYNDINQENIMVGEDSLSVLVVISCR